MNEHYTARFLFVDDVKLWIIQRIKFMMLTLDLMRYEHYNIHTSDKNRCDGTLKKLGIKRERNDKYENCFMENRQTFLINSFFS